MIVYKDILKQLSENGYSTYRLSKEKIIHSATIDRIRKGLSISTNTIDTVCELLDCQPGDILRYEPSDKQGK